MVNATAYIARIVSAIGQSKLARRALHEFRESPDAVAKLITEEADELQALFQKVRCTAADGRSSGCTRGRPGRLWSVIATRPQSSANAPDFLGIPFPTHCHFFI